MTHQFFIEEGQFYLTKNYTVAYVLDLTPQTTEIVIRFEDGSHFVGLYSDLLKGDFEFIKKIEMTVNWKEPTNTSLTHQERSFCYNDFCSALIIDDVPIAQGNPYTFKHSVDIIFEDFKNINVSNMMESFAEFSVWLGRNMTVDEYYIEKHYTSQAWRIKLQTLSSLDPHIHLQDGYTVWFNDSTKILKELILFTENKNN